MREKDKDKLEREREKDREKEEKKARKRQAKGHHVHRSDDHSISSLDSVEGMASITPEDLYTTGGLLSNNSTSRPGSPVVTSASNARKRMSMPLGISSMSGQKKLASSLLNLSPHRRRPSLQTRSLSGGLLVAAAAAAGTPPPSSSSSSTLSSSASPYAYANSTNSTSSSLRSSIGVHHVGVGSGGSGLSPTSSLKSASAVSASSTSTLVSVAASPATPTTTATPSSSSSTAQQVQQQPATPSSHVFEESTSSGKILPRLGSLPERGPSTGADGQRTTTTMNADSPTTTSYEKDALPSAGGDGPRYERRFAQSYPLETTYDDNDEDDDDDDWDNDAVVAEDEVEAGEHGTKKIADSRRILSPNTPIEEEPAPPVPVVNGEGDDRFPDFRLEPTRSVSISDLRAKARSNSTTSSRSYYGIDKVASVTPAPPAETTGQARRTTTGQVSFEIHTPRRVPSDASLNQSALSDPPSRPGSVPPRPGMNPRASSTRSMKDTDSNSTTSSLRVSSLNQIAALKQQMANNESQPPKSSSSNSSSEALSVESKTPSHRKASALATERSAQLLIRKYPPSIEPPLPDPLAPKVDPAPSSGMYWYKTLSHGFETTPFRAHSCTLVGSSIYVFGGCDAKSCFNDLYVFDADSMYWSKPAVQGEVPPPLRAMTATAVGKKLVIFGGGDGPTYYNDLYVLDTVTHRFTKPKVSGTLPSKRRAHTACLYKHGLYVFGGGDGVRALNDVWRLDVADMTKLSWKLISSPTSSASSKSSGRNPAGTSVTSLLAVTTPSSASRPTSSSIPPGSTSRPAVSSPNATLKLKPTARGYHTANMVQNKLIIFGGSDGVECFRDVWVFDVETNVWKCVEIKTSFPRLSHTATIIGSYLFVVGGHDGADYCSEVLLLNLVTMQWDRRKVYGRPPSGRGYHGAVLHDSRLFVIGGFDGHQVFNDTYILELAVSSYYSQISHFTIEV